MKDKIINATIIAFGITARFFFYMFLITAVIMVYDEYLAGAFASYPTVTVDTILIAGAFDFTAIELFIILLESLISKFKWSRGKEND